MAAFRKVHAHDGIPRVKHRKINRDVRLSAGMRLYIGVLRTKQLAGSLAGNLLHHIHALAASVVTLARIAFGIFVGKHAAHSRHYCRRNQVLRGDQLQVAALSLQLLVHSGPDLVIERRDKR